MSADAIESSTIDVLLTEAVEMTPCPPTANLTVEFVVKLMKGPVYEPTTGLEKFANISVSVSAGALNVMFLTLMLRVVAKSWAVIVASSIFEVLTMLSARSFAAIVP